MIRIKRGVVKRRRRKKILQQSKGFFGTKHKSYRSAKEQLMKSWSYSYRDRKRRPSFFRKQRICVLNSFLRQRYGINYSRFIKLMHDSDVSNFLDTKVISLMIKEGNFSLIEKKILDKK